MEKGTCQLPAKPNKKDQPLTEYQKGLVELSFGLVRLEIQRAERRGIQTDDECESEAIWAAIQASRRYDPSKGWKWSSYVTPWIIRAIYSASRSRAKVKPFIIDKLSPELAKALRLGFRDDKEESPERMEEKALASKAVQSAFSQFKGDELIVAKLLLEGLGRRGITKRLGITAAIGRAWTEEIRTRLFSFFGMPGPHSGLPSPSKRSTPTPRGKRRLTPLKEAAERQRAKNAKPSLKPIRNEAALSA